jgi:hypothetical protein
VRVHLNWRYLAMPALHRLHESVFHLLASLGHACWQRLPNYRVDTFIHWCLPYIITNRKYVWCFAAHTLAFPFISRSLISHEALFKQAAYGGR